jgi:ectoine hydroxylase-related dioxygenase (phytanoyl-CoA dioxygenase family)
MDEATVAAHVARIAEVGYTIVPDAIEVDLLDELADALDRLEHDLGAVPAENAFEGHHTVRIYNLLAHGEVFARIPTHPEVLPVVEGVLDDGCLISSLSSIAIDPGESAQMIHADDQLIPIPKPHVPVVCNTMWALTDFTEPNGATRLVPGTHLADGNPDLRETHPTVPAEMARGSVLIWHGSLWHGGGANTSAARRTGIAMNYCAGWVRQQENQQLGLAPSLVATFPKRLQELVGYGIYHGLIGHIDKRPPRKLLRSDTDKGASLDGSGRMLWDALD